MSSRYVGVVGALSWAAQPAYIAVELVIALQARGAVGYSIGADSISSLGVACATAADAQCAPGHAGMNVAFALFGLLQVAGSALWLRIAPSRWRAVATSALWAVAGLASVGVALAPLDAHPTAHLLVATPIFVAQPAALLLQAGGLPPRLRLPALLTAALCGVMAVAFLTEPLGPQWSGAAERAAVWPVKVWLGLVGVLLLSGALPRRPTR